jgi:hypothetical protein
MILICLRIGTSGGLLWIRLWAFGFHKMLGSSWVAAQLAASQEGLSSKSEWVSRFRTTCMTTEKKSSVYFYRCNLIRKPLDAENRLKERQLKNVPPYVFKGVRNRMRSKFHSHAVVCHVPAVTLCWLLWTESLYYTQSEPTVVMFPSPYV